MLRCARSGHVHEPPDDSSAGRRSARPWRPQKDKLMRQEFFFDEFCREFAKEMNRLRMVQRAT